MQVTIGVLEGDVYEFIVDLPDTLDTSDWTHFQWLELADAMQRARYHDLEQLSRIAGDVTVRERHVEGDSDVQFVEAGEDVVYTRYSREIALEVGLLAARAWCEQQPNNAAVLQLIDGAIWRVEC